MAGYTTSFHGHVPHGLAVEQVVKPSHIAAGFSPAFHQHTRWPLPTRSPTHSLGTHVGVLTPQNVWLHKQLQRPHYVCGLLQGQRRGQGTSGLSTQQPSSLLRHWPQEITQNTSKGPDYTKPVSLPPASALASMPQGRAAPQHHRASTEELWLRLRQRALLCQTEKAAQQQKLLPSCLHRALTLAG